MIPSVPAAVKACRARLVAAPHNRRQLVPGGELPRVCHVSDGPHLPYNPRWRGICTILYEGPGSPRPAAGSRHVTAGAGGYHALDTHGPRGSVRWGDRERVRRQAGTRADQFDTDSHGDPGARAAPSGAHARSRFARDAPASWNAVADHAAAVNYETFSDRLLSLERCLSRTLRLESTRGEAPW
jgi:hypothetical protein